MVDMARQWRERYTQHRNETLGTAEHRREGARIKHEQTD